MKSPVFPIISSVLIALVTSAFAACDRPEDLDPCEILDCGDHGHCAISDGVPECVCEGGYVLEGGSCVSSSDGDADADADGDADGDCEPGYSSEGGECVDIDECAQGAADCDENASCENLPGGFECLCDDGFTGTGLECADIDECLDETDDCDDFAICSNTIGGYECACPECMVGDGRRCEPQPGCGHVVLIGHDYLRSNEATERIVGNAVFLAGSSVRVLGYTEFADVTEEVAGTNDAIEARAAELGRSWSLTRFDEAAQLPELLPDFDVLLVYEQERSNQDELQSVGESWYATLQPFVHRGGVVVVCDHTSGGFGILNGAALMEIHGSTGLSRAEVAVTAPDDPVVADVSHRYPAVEGSASFTTDEPDVVAIAPSGEPVVLHAARLWSDLIVLPYDFYQWDEDAASLLLRAVTMGFPRLPSVGIVSDCVDGRNGADSSNPSPPYDQGEYGATLAALQHAGLPPESVLELEDVVAASRHSHLYDVLLFPESETCAWSSTEWRSVVGQILGSGGRVVALGGQLTGEFLSGMEIFGSGTREPLTTPLTVTVEDDDFWLGLVHPPWLSDTTGYRWSGPGLRPLASLSADPEVLTVWGYSVD